MKLIIQYPYQKKIFFKKKYYDNYILYYNIIKHLDKSDKNIYEIEINKDGNCFYNSLSYFFTRKQDL